MTTFLPPTTYHLPLIVITGPTASGKSGLALKLAEQYDGEIICADSRTVYTGMDIGTAKPTAEDRARVAHHLLDVIEPNERSTVHDFQQHAKAAIEDIRSRGKLPFLVGGSGLYIDSVVLDMKFPKLIDETLQKSLNDKSVDELQVMIKKRHLVNPVNLLNKRHLVSTLLRGKSTSVSLEKPDENTIVVAITTDKTLLQKRIIKRARNIFSSGVIQEAKVLGDKYGWENESMTGNIYPILHQLLDGKISEEEAIERFIIRDRQLTKRQITWLKRHDFVQRMDLPHAEHYLHNILTSSRS